MTRRRDQHGARDGMHPLWLAYQAAHDRDEYARCDEIDQAWDQAYDAAAETVGENAPDAVFDNARADYAWATLNGTGR